MGETMEDRISMAFDLAGLKADSIPINVLTPITGTPLENKERLTEEEILRTIAVFRFLNPKAEIRLAAGRNLMEENGRRAFLSGANGAITGDMLTTSGNNTEDDRQLLIQLGYSLNQKEEKKNEKTRNQTDDTHWLDDGVDLCCGSAHDSAAVYPGAHLTY